MYFKLCTYVKCILVGFQFDKALQNSSPRFCSILFVSPLNLIDFICKSIEINRSLNFTFFSIFEQTNA